MYYHGNNDWRDYLAHYGVKGMKKGKHLPGTSWWKDLTGLKYKDEANRQGAIQKKEQMLADAAYARSTQAYNPNRSDKDIMRGRKNEDEFDKHMRKSSEARDKKIDAINDYDKNKLSEKARKAVKEATNPIKSAWKTKVTGEAYKRGAHDNLKKAKNAQDWSNASGNDIAKRSRTFNHERNATVSSRRETGKLTQKQAEKAFNDDYKNRESWQKYDDVSYHVNNAKKEARRASEYLKTANANQKSYYEKSLKGKAENFIKKKFKKKRYYDKSDL